MTTDFTHTTLPVINKQVLRLGVAGNYGLDGNDIAHAASRGVNYWVWSPHMKKVTPALKELLAAGRDRHVVAAFGIAYTAGMVRRQVRKSLKLLGSDHIDAYLLSWYGKMSFYTDSIQRTLQDLKQEGKVLALGTSIHDRQRAGELAADSILDLLMIRYNAKHPGAEQDIFPHLHHRDPAVICYTATSWRQLLKPLKGIEMPPWPGDAAGNAPPPLDASHCYRFCLGNPHVHVTLTGPKTREQLDANLDVLEQGPLSAEEEQWVRDYGKKVKAKKRFGYF
ncbi:aldo/keto reductase [Gemmatimonadota bacterium]